MSLMRSWIKCGHYLCFRRANEMSIPDHWEKYGEELLRFAANLHSPETMRQLLKIVDLCLLSNGDIGRIIFSECARYLPDVGCLEAIVRAGIDLDRDFGNGERPLHVFVKNVQMKRWSKFDRAVELLCQHGANINQEDGNGRTVLEELCQRLIDSLDNLQSKSNQLDERLMHESLSIQDKLGTQMVKALLHNGACLPRLGCGQLHALLRQSCSSVVKTLVKHGMDPYVLDEEGQPLLTLAIRLGNADLVDCLWTHGHTSYWKGPSIPNCIMGIPSQSVVCETNHGPRKHIIGPQLKEIAIVPSVRVSDRKTDAVGNVHREACLACFSTGKFLLHKQLLMNDVVRKAVRENKPGAVKALYDYGIMASAPSARFQITKDEDGLTLQCLLCLGKWKTSNVHRSLLLHSSLSLMEAYTLDRENLHDKHPDVFMIQQRDNLLAFATESFKQSLVVGECVEEARESNRQSCKPETFNIAGKCITEAKDATEFQKLLSTTIPSRRTLKELSAIHLHGLLVMERLGDSRCELYVSMISNHLWTQNDGAANVAGALACHDFLLHHIQGAQQRSPGLYTAYHHFECANKVGALLQWLFHKLSPRHRIRVLPVCRWLISLAIGPLFKRQMQLLSIAGTIFGLSEMISKHELQPSVKLFSDLTAERGKQWNVLFVMLQLKTDFFIKHNLPSYCLETSLQTVQSYSLATTDIRMAAMASTLLKLGMALPDLEGSEEHLFKCLLGQPKLLEVCILHGLDIWQKDSTGTPLVCGPLNFATYLGSSRSDVLHLLVGDIIDKLPSHDSYELAESAYSQQLQDHGGDQWDLWLLAIARQSVPDAQVLHEHRLPARREALLSAAVHESEEMFEFLLTVRTWCSTDLMDAYNLRSAHHLHMWLKHGSERYQLVDPNSERFATAHFKNLNFQFFPAALRLFEKSLQFKARSTDRQVEALYATKNYVGAGFEFYEAKTKDELLKLAGKVIPVRMKVHQVKNVHGHGLLVMQRLIPRHAKCFEYFQTVFEKLTGTHDLEYLCFPIMKPEIMLDRVMLCFKLIQHFLHVGEDSSDFQKFDFPGSALCLAIYISTRLLQSNILIDVSQVFQAAAHALVSSPSLGCDIQHMITHVCILLLAMGRHRKSQPVVMSMEAAVQLLVKACGQGRAKTTTFLHELVLVWSRSIQGPEWKFMRNSSADVKLFDFSNIRCLLKEFLDAGADLNAFDRSGRMAAHYVIDSECSRQGLQSPVEERLSLLTLFDQYGIHWDAFGRESRSLLELFTETPSMKSLVWRLKSKPRDLQCIAAQVAAQARLNYSFLPKRIQRFIELHQPGVAIDRLNGAPGPLCGFSSCFSRVGWGFRFDYNQS